MHIKLNKAITTWYRMDGFLYAGNGYLGNEDWKFTKMIDNGKIIKMCSNTAGGRTLYYSESDKKIMITANMNGKYGKKIRLETFGDCSKYDFYNGGIEKHRKIIRGKNLNPITFPQAKKGLEYLSNNLRGIQ